MSNKTSTGAWSVARVAATGPAPARTPLVSAGWVRGLSLAVLTLAGNAASSAAGPAPAAPAASFALPGQDSPEVEWWRKSMLTHDERLQWWRAARFGMFIHWGVYSALGNEFHGRRGATYSEHIQRVLKIPIPVYRKEVAGSFNPASFDAGEWVRLARDAGMGYLVITAKHHDGFAMWPSKVSTYNIADATPFQRDPLRELREACRKYGIKFGFYYSHAFDWGEADGPGNDWDYQNPGGDRLLGGAEWWRTTPEFLPRARKYVDGKSLPQLMELIRDYDPDILWFDTPHKLPPSENLRILKAVREASPRVVINGRLVRGWGDYASTADRPAEFPPQAGDWEGIPTTNESYGWNQFDLTHKDPAFFVRLLAKAVARGGNLLMNVGPMGDGRIDPRDVAILGGIGSWWKVNGESIRGCGRTPLPVQAWGESTRQGGTLYLHVLAWPPNGRLVVGGLESSVRRAYLLSDARRAPLAVERLNPLDVAVHVPAEAPDSADSVVALECDGEIATDTARLLQPDYPTDTLRALDARLGGRGLQFGAGKTRDAYIIGWTRSDAFVTWPVRLTAPAAFELTAVYDAEARSAGNAFAVTVGGQSLKSTVSPGAVQKAVLGRIALEAGTYELKVAPRALKAGELMRLRSLELKPVK